MTNLTDSIEGCRQFWAKIAKQNDWYTEPFFVQVWQNEKGEILDSVSFRGMTHDILITNRGECLKMNLMTKGVNHEHPSVPPNY